MDITGISSNDPITGAASNAPGTLDKDAFLKLLVSQVKNQDPMQPQGSAEYVAQLAQFSSLEQMQNLNDNIVGLALLQQNNALMSQLTQSSALIGQNVEWTDPQTGVVHTGQVTSEAPGRPRAARDRRSGRSARERDAGARPGRRHDGRGRLHRWR